MDYSSSRVVIIGAGIGGMSAAISLAAKGLQVTILEKNSHLGGKLNVLEKDGFRFDLGPSIFTLPQIFRPLFDSPGKQLEDYISLKRVDPQWRNFFEDGTVFNLWEKIEAMREELAHLHDGISAYVDYKNFVDYSRQQYEVIERGYLREGLDGFWELVRFYGLSKGREIDWLHSMSGAINKRVLNPYLRDMFAYFIKYVGSSANDSPGFMNLMPYIQLGFGLWYIEGGLFELSRAFERRMRELGVSIRLETEAIEIQRAGDRVTGVLLRKPNGEAESLTSDFVISNMEVIPTARHLLNQTPSQLKHLSKFEPACSGIVVHLGLNRTYPQLAHHNLFYSNDQSRHFNRVFREKRLPDDPTIYLVAPTRSDPSQAPKGYENIKILPHIPYINASAPYTYEDCVKLKEICFQKLERMGLSDLRRHIILEDFWTPFDIEKKYYSNGGSIYGVVCDRFKNFAFKAPRKSRDYKNLFFAGGSTNPGGGLPMVSLSGQHVAREILAQLTA